MLAWAEGTAFRARLNQLSREQFYSEWLPIKRLQILPASRSQRIDELPPARNNIWHSTPMHPILLFCQLFQCLPRSVTLPGWLKVLPTPSGNSLQSITLFLSVVRIHPINQRRMNVTIILRLTSLIVGSRLLASSCHQKWWVKLLLILTRRFLAGKTPIMDTTNWTSLWWLVTCPQENASNVSFHWIFDSWSTSWCCWHGNTTCWALPISPREVYRADNLDWDWVVPSNECLGTTTAYKQGNRYTTWIG